MKTVLLSTLIVAFAFATKLSADVSISELDDRIRVKIDGQIFTEWRHKEWVAPYLYPVIGPNGENVTRHYPMKQGVPGEDPDHPWHRSIRFSHSDVNGFNFWWAPGKDKAGHTAEVKLERIERIASGKTGEVILWNQWLGDSNTCPACASHSGDYTIAASASLKLRNRFYFHHGDPLTAKVAEQYRAYTSDPESTVLLMRELQQQRKWRELITQFAQEDFAAWPAELSSKAIEALELRGLAYSFTKDGKKAEADLKMALKLAPQNAGLWLSLADNYTNNLNDDEQALAAYRQALKIAGKSNGWQSITATLSVAHILTDQVKPDEAIEVLRRYGDMIGMAPVWKIKMLRAYGHAYAAQGKEQESLASFREALLLESKP